MMNVLLELVTKDGAYKINSLNFTLKLLTINLTTNSYENSNYLLG